MKETAGAQPAAPFTLDAASDVDRAIALWKRGASPNAIGAELGVSQQVVRRWLREHGFETSRPYTWRGLLSVSEASVALAVNRHSLVDAAKAGRVRHRGTSNFYGPTTYLFDRTELETDVARLRCRHEGCAASAIGESRGCEHHGHLYLGDRAAGVKRPDIGPKIAAAKRGHARPDALERLKASWKTGGAFARAAIEHDWITGATRRIWKLRWAPKPGRPRREWSPEQVAEVLRLHEKGFGYETIAAKVADSMTAWQVRQIVGAHRPS